MIEGGYTTITGDRRTNLAVFEKQMAEAGTFAFGMGHGGDPEKRREISDAALPYFHAGET